MTLAELQELIVYVMGTAVLIGALFTVVVALFGHER